MLLKEFMQDNMPLAKGSVKIPIKGLRAQYRERYDKLVKSKKFLYDIYRVTPTGRNVVHVKVPSETLEKFYYDVLLEVEPTPMAHSLEQCNVKFFSNCPSFVYTYAYIFYHLDTDTGGDKTPSSRPSPGAIIQMLVHKIPRQHLLMSGTESKLGDAVLDNAPDIRNPHRLIMLDKSIYYAVFYLEDNVPLSSIISSRRYRTEAQVIVSVADFDGLMARRKQQEQREKQKRQNKTKELQQKADSAALKTRSAPMGTAARKLQPIAPIRSVSTVRPVKMATRVKKPSGK